MGIVCVKHLGPFLLFDLFFGNPGVDARVGEKHQQKKHHQVKQVLENVVLCVDGNGKKVLAQVLYAVTFDVFVRHTDVNHFVFKHIS